MTLSSHWVHLWPSLKHSFHPEYDGLPSAGQWGWCYILKGSAGSLSGLRGKCLGTKTNQTGWCQQCCRRTGGLFIEKRHEIEDRVLSLKMSLLYTVVGLCMPLGRMKECPGNAFQRKTAETAVPSPKRSGFIQAFTNCLFLIWHPSVTEITVNFTIIQINAEEMLLFSATAIKNILECVYSFQYSNIVHLCFV